MNFFSKKIVGIDIHDYSIEVTELNMEKNRVFLESYNRSIIPDDIVHEGEIRKENELASLVSQALQNANPKPILTKNVAIVLPSEKVFTHIFTFPSTLSEEEVKKAIPFEAETIIPFNIQDIYWDYIVIEKEELDKKRNQYVLFTAILKEVANKYITVLETLNLSPTLFGIHAETLKYALWTLLGKGKTNIIIDVGTLSTNYLIIKNGKTKYFFSSNECGKKLITSLAMEFSTDEATLLDKKEKGIFDKKYISSIEHFIENNYKLAQNIITENENNKNIGQITDMYLTGEFLNLANFYELAKNYFPKQNIHIGDPKTGLNIDTTKFLSPTKKQEIIPYSIYFTNAVGIALNSLVQKNSLNLMPDRLKQTISHKKNTLLIALSAIAITAISLFTSTVLGFKHQEMVFMRTNLEIEKSAIDKVLYGTRYQEIRDTITKFNEEVSTLREIDKRLISIPLIMDDIWNHVPKEINITSIQWKDDEMTVMVNGIANTRDALLETKKNFESDPFIEQVTAPISNYDQKSNISFQINLKLSTSKLPIYGSSTNIQ
ncbi:pilus assembly protein PilM [Candidatus Peregrinibacteria bacterium]|nr:pilus assembly protein PilM [Candidatus Peregrinibacteria bacterium]